MSSVNTGKRSFLDLFLNKVKNKNVSPPIMCVFPQWPTGPWIRPTSSETQRPPGPTKCHRQTSRGWRTSPRRPGWSTRSVTVVTHDHEEDYDGCPASSLPE